MSSITIGIIGIAILFIILFLRVPIGLAMAVVGFAGFAVLGSMSGALNILELVPYDVVTDYNFAVVPLFVLMGCCAAETGIVRDMYAAAYKWVGQFRGGLVSATILACGAFAAVTGSAMAGTATMGKIVAPEVAKYKYDNRFVAGAIAVGGTLGSLIPPSMVFILYGILTEQSIGKLFMAGIIPGIIVIIFYLVTIFIQCRINPAIGPAGPKTSLKEKGASLRHVLPALILFGIVMAGIYGGIFTPTEAAAAGAFGALVIGLVMKRLSFQGFKKSLSDSARITSMMILLLIGAFIFNKFLSVSRIPFELAGLITGLAMPRYFILSIIIFAYIILGCAFDLLSIMVLTIPIVFPIITNLGFDPIFFGVLIARVMEVGSITPPIGINSYVLAGIMDVPPGTVFRGIIPFLVSDFINIALLMALPQISLFLPSVMMGG
jgi:C4-dicarboxylate transporter DctM subunit